MQWLPALCLSTAESALQPSITSLVAATGHVLLAGGKMAYGAIDAIGGAMSPKVVKSLRKSGKYILYGALDTSPVSASNADLLALTKVSTSLCCMSLSPVVGCCATLNMRHRILLYTQYKALYLAVSCCTL